MIKEISNLTFLYIKKLFSVKNIIMFLAIFFLIYTLFYSVNKIVATTTTSQADDLKEGFWIMTIIFTNIYFNLILSYSYIFLKKNNLEKIDNRKNTISNLIIILLLFALFYLIFYIAFSLGIQEIKYKSDGTLNTLFLEPFTLFFVFMFFNLISLSILGLIPMLNNKLGKMEYIVIMVSFVISIIFFFYIERLILMYSTAVSSSMFKHMIKIEGLLFASLIGLNLLKRIVFK